MVLTVTKPTVGGSEDSWGTTINTALDDIVLEINSNADGTNAITLKEGGFAVGATTVTVTGAEFNILDGDTAATSTNVADADRVVFNDAGTMKQVAMSDIKTYINASVGSGSVTEVAMTVPTGLTVSGTPITTSGTLAVSLQSGYSIPTTSSQSNWNTAYGWGDHSSQGYLTSAPAPTSSQVGSAMAGLSTGAVGTFAFAMISTSTASTSVSVPNGTTTSSLFYTDRSASNSASYKTSGTWKCMGYATNEDRGTVWMRIA